jgi:hypothetical protein
MRHMLRFGWAAAIGLAIGGAGLAQTTGGTTGGSTGGRTGGSTSTGGANSTGTPQTFLDTSALDSGIGATTGSSALNSSNALSKYYANPLYQGRAGASAGETPGGFGTAMFATGGTSGGRTGGATGGRTTGTSGLGGTTGGRTGTGGFGTTGLGSTTGLGGGTTGLGGGATGLGGQGGRTGFGGGQTGFGGTTGFGGATGLGGTTGFGGQGGRGGRAGGFGGTGFGGTQNPSQVIQQPRPIAYTSQLRFTPPPMTATRMQTEVRAVLDRSTVLSNARGITVESDGAMVVLKGTVRDEDEARLVEGMIRLTPGVRDVKNELRFAGSPPTP